MYCQNLRENVSNQVENNLNDHVIWKCVVDRETPSCD